MSQLVLDVLGTRSSAALSACRTYRYALHRVWDETREHLPPPHMKPLQGQAAAGLRELRPRRGNSDWRALYRRCGSLYVVLSIDRHANFVALTARAQARAAPRAARYATPLESR